MTHSPFSAQSLVIYLHRRYYHQGNLSAIIVFLRLLNRRVKVDLRSGWHDTSGVDRLVRTIVMLLDMIHIDSALNVRHLIQLASEAPEVRVIYQSLLVRLEVTYRHRYD